MACASPARYAAAGHASERDAATRSEICTNEPEPPPPRENCTNELSPCTSEPEHRHTRRMHERIPIGGTNEPGSASQCGIMEQTHLPLGGL